MARPPKVGLPYSKMVTGHVYPFDDFEKLCDFVRKANEYPNAKIYIQRGIQGEKADAKLVIDISRLGIQRCETVTITATGFQKTDAVCALCAFIRAYHDPR